jgi:hypothetical protein
MGEYPLALANRALAASALRLADHQAVHIRCHGHVVGLRVDERVAEPLRVEVSRRELSQALARPTTSFSSAGTGPGALAQALLQSSAILRQWGLQLGSVGLVAPIRAVATGAFS